MEMTIDEAHEILSNGLANAPSEHEWCEAFKIAMDTMRKYQQLEDFARWVAVEVIDEEMWTYNHLSFAELACRKLVQLGVTHESDGEYTYEVVEDGET